MLDSTEQHANPFSVAVHGKYYAIPKRFMCNYGGCSGGRKRSVSSRTKPSGGEKSTKSLGLPYHFSRRELQ